MLVRQVMQVRQVVQVGKQFKKAMKQVVMRVFKYKHRGE